MFGDVSLKAEIVNGTCPTCTCKTLLVSIEMVAVLQEKVKKLENKEDVVVDLSSIESNISEIEEGLAQTKVKSLVNSKEIELLKVQIEEIKVSTSNPLSN